jgi:hypothetical protein
MAKGFYTVGEVAGMHSWPGWKMRRLVDELGTVERFGQYRLVPARMLGKIAAAVKAYRRSPCGRKKKELEAVQA